VNHGGNDVLAPHEAGEKVAALLEESPLFLRWQTREERQVGCDNQAAEDNSIFAYCLGQIESLDSGLNRSGIVAQFRLVQIVVLAALLAPDVGIRMASPLAPVVALDAAQGLAFELIHMKDEVGHGGSLVIGDVRRVDALHEGADVFHAPR